MTKDGKKKSLERILIVLMLILMAILVGLNRIKTSDFSPINGDFQNYNPVRRLLNGQIPFKDFAVYLGSGHMFLTAFFQIFIGNTFTKSLFVNDMVTFMCFEIFTFFLVFLVLKDKRKALYFTLCFAVLDITRPFFMDIIIDDQFLNALIISLNSSSARLIRIFIAPLLCIFLYLGDSFFNKSQNNFINRHRELLKKIYMAFLAGFAIPWSNDGGVATYISISFIYFLMLIKEYKKNIKKIILDTFLYIFVSLLTLVIVITLITRGSPLSWFTYTMGVSSYQSWYYAFGPSKLNIDVTQIDSSLYNLSLIVLLIYSIIRIFKEKNDRMLLFHELFSIICCSVITSTYLYQLGSGGIETELVNLCLVIIIFAIVFQYLVKCIKKIQILKLLKIGVLLFCGAIIAINIHNEIENYQENKSRNVTVQQLGGSLGNGKIINSMTEYAKDAKIFSVYSTAISVTTNQFQPSGIDYIIHAMGNQQREEYLQSFMKDNIDLVEDINKTNLWYGWIRNANWFFYRELYKNYKPIFSGDYNVFYEKMTDEEMAINNPDINNYEISIDKINESNTQKYLLTVKSLGGGVTNGIVDVKIKYNSSFTSNRLLGLYLNRYIYVEDVTSTYLYPSRINNYNIPTDENEYYVPVILTNGEGVIKISSVPYGKSEVNIESAEILNVYTMPFRYLTPAINNPFKNHNIYIENNSENEIILEGVKQLKRGQEVINIDDIEINQNFIVLHSNDDTTNFCFPFSFEVIK